MTKEIAEAGTRDSALRWEVFMTPGIPTAATDLPPGTKQGMWPPISSTLIYGKQDAVLVDAFITAEQADALAGWVKRSGKNLTTIYITHGHGDHFFGIGALLDRFPNSRAVATPDVVKVMRHQTSPQSLASFWNPFFPQSDFPSSCDCRRNDRKRAGPRGTRFGRYAAWTYRHGLHDLPARSVNRVGRGG